MSFFGLGYIDEIAKAAGLMRGYGLQMWVILQDLGQLVKLYGREGAETFFGNADVHQFFRNTDPMTLEWISARVSNFAVSDLPNEPQFESSQGYKAAKANTRHKPEQTNDGLAKLTPLESSKPREMRKALTNGPEKTKNSTTKLFHASTQRPLGCLESRV